MKQQGFADVLIGLQFGDEGKARVIDNLAQNYDIIARFNGGSNAGHTIEKGNIKLALHQIPSGVFYPTMTLYIGSGCVVNIQKLAEELREVNALGIDVTKRLKISSLASIVQPHHMFLDGFMGKSIGTLKHGIGPAYADRAMRMYGERLVNIRLADLADNPNHFFKIIATNLKEVQKQYADPDLNKQQELEKVYAKLLQSLKKSFEVIKPYIELDPLYIEKRVEKGAKILFEGAQSTMLDVVKGSVPFVTSSNTLAAAAYTGGDLSSKYHRKTIGVAKAIMSRVGYGPFPSEFGGKKSEVYSMEEKDGKSKVTRATEATIDVEKLIKSTDPFEVGIALRVGSGEYGATSGRPRRIGCLDLVLLAHAVKMNGVDELVITKCDVLREYSKTKDEQMPLVTGYTLDGTKIDYVPGATNAFYRVVPQIKMRKIFSEDVCAVRSFEKLPQSLKAFVQDVEKASGCKVIGLGVGPKRDQYIVL